MLIAMAVYDTEQNGRSELTRITLKSLERTVDWSKHRLIISDNGSCQKTVDIYHEFSFPFDVIYNGENLGTARAINKAWRYRINGEPCVKMDNDVYIHQQGWADWMIDVFERDPKIGICGLKRKDLAECPWSNSPFWKSEVYMLPHEAGQRWLIVEEVEHVIGTCQAYSSLLLDKIGYLNQPDLYGYDDSLASVRAGVAGFKRVFLHGFEIDHLYNEENESEYQDWKKEHAKRYGKAYQELKNEYVSGERTVYHDEYSDCDVSC